MASQLRVSRFSVDVTIPLGHRCMGLLPTKSKEIVDPLQTHGIVLLSDDDPIVIVAVDWCEIRNESYERWREVIAKAVGTEPVRVLLSSLHQHDAPVVDGGAENLLNRAGLTGELFDFAFQEDCVQRVAAAAKESLEDATPVTHLGLGKAKVEKVASNRRVVHPDGRVSFGRGSSSGGNAFMAEAPDGLIDPWLRTISFWNGDKPLVALHSYATHPMSYYGRGGVTYDFVGMARERRRRDDQKVHQIYLSGCSGDVTAGRYNDGSPASRELLAHRIYEGMTAAWDATEKTPISEVRFRSTPLELPFRTEERFTAAYLLNRIEDDSVEIRQRIHAAMTLSSRQRVVSGKPIDLPVVDLGPARIVLFPGEAFVGYQLLAQEMKQDVFVQSIGYGECWPGYVPTDSCFDDKFEDTWLWVGPGCETRIREALAKVL
ncbi:MAG: hypothetical protein O2983_06105 [Planctomycetota bacterium]|nr:hypothetical protein [Planctomycetota bacterium]MDA0921769.1 hypothetical protein [Planctomycetota bacterium]MDA1159167.1 hypothetical protein [Planctomycetota bacterium]